MNGHSIIVVIRQSPGKTQRRIGTLQLLSQTNLGLRIIRIDRIGIDENLRRLPLRCIQGRSRRRRRRCSRLRESLKARVIGIGITVPILRHRRFPARNPKLRNRNGGRCAFHRAIRLRRVHLKAAGLGLIDVLKNIELSDGCLGIRLDIVVEGQRLVRGHRKIRLR